MGAGQSVISLIIPQAEGTILTASVRGYGKRTDVTEFPTKGRGTQGVIAMVTSDRNGALVGAKQVFDGDEVMMISDQGTLVRTSVEGISVLSRNTQGVTLIRLADDEHLVGIERIEEPAEDESVLDVAETPDSEIVAATPGAPDANGATDDVTGDDDDAGDQDSGSQNPDDQ
jgi:DNA gyrase subunit A